MRRRARDNKNAMQYKRIVPAFLQQYQSIIDPNSVRSSTRQQQPDVVETDPNEEEELDDVEKQAIEEYKKEEEAKVVVQDVSIESSSTMLKKKSKHEILKDSKVDEKTKKRKTIKKVQNKTLLSFDLDDE